MTFRLSLFRAIEGLGPMSTWEREQREPLGTRDEIKAALDGVLPELRWEDSNRMLFASGPFGGDEHAFELWLFGAPDEMLMDIDVYSAPPAVRAIMSGLRLNYCYAQESGELRDPFKAGDHWPGSVRQQSGNP
jgi:hypothetical protein